MRKFALAGVAALLLGAAMLPGTADAAVTIGDGGGAISLLNPMTQGFEASSNTAAGGSADFVFNVVGADIPSLRGNINAIPIPSMSITSIQLFGDNAPSTDLISSITPALPGPADEGLSVRFFANLLNASANYTLRVTWTGQGTVSGQVIATPVPAAILLLGPALAGLGVMGRRRKDETAAVAA